MTDFDKARIRLSEATEQYGISAIAGCPICNGSGLIFDPAISTTGVQFGINLTCEKCSGVGAILAVLASPGMEAVEDGMIDDSS